MLLFLSSVPHKQAEEKKAKEALKAAKAAQKRMLVSVAEEWGGVAMIWSLPSDFTIVSKIGLTISHTQRNSTRHVSRLHPVQTMVPVVKVQTMATLTTAILARVLGSEKQAWRLVSMSSVVESKIRVPWHKIPWNKIPWHGTPWHGILWQTAIRSNQTRPARTRHWACLWHSKCI